jgi:hypothetical protein
MFGISGFLGRLTIRGTLEEKDETGGSVLSNLEGVLGNYLEPMP